MYKDAKVFIVICAGGTGERMGESVPKQFIKLEDRRSILRTSYDAFFTGGIAEVKDHILVTSPEGYEEETEIALSEGHENEDLTIVTGGSDRQESVMNAVRAAFDKGASDDDIVLVHDAARPFVTDRILMDSVKTCYESGAAVTAVPVKDTIRDAEKGTLDRERLYSVQTPQTFRLGIIRKALEKAEEDGFRGTDDAGLVERTGLMPVIVEGSYANIKITTPEDLRQ